MENKKRQFYDKRIQKLIPYIEVKEFEERQKTENCFVSGEIFIKEKDSLKNALIKKMQGRNEDISVFPIGTYKESAYKTIGYIPCENNEYISVKKKRKTKLAVGICVAVLIVLIFLLGKLFIHTNDKNDGPIIDPNASNYTSALKRPEDADDSKILIPGYGKWTMKKGSDTIESVLFNPEDNPCYFKFTIIEKSTGNILYESKLVPPGKGITPIKLNKAFDETGTYDLIMKFQTFSLGDASVSYNGSDVEIQLNVVE